VASAKSVKRGARMPPKKKKSKHAPKNPAKKHGTRKYQKDGGGPSWDTDDKLPNVDEIMAIIERNPKDLELYRKHLVALSNDPAARNLSMTEKMNIAEMNMLRGMIVEYMLGIDDLAGLEELRESNKMLRFIWDKTDKIIKEARERAPVGGDLEGMSQVIADAEDGEYEVIEDADDKVDTSSD